MGASLFEHSCAGKLSVQNARDTKVAARRPPPRKTKTLCRLRQICIRGSSRRKCLKRVNLSAMGIRGDKMHSRISHSRHKQAEQKRVMPKPILPGVKYVVLAMLRRCGGRFRQLRAQIVRRLVSLRAAIVLAQFLHSLPRSEYVVLTSAILFRVRALLQSAPDVTALCTEFET